MRPTISAGTHASTRRCLEESAALVEWPVAIAGHFDTDFLTLPDAVLIATMQGHQRYFPVADAGGALMPHFIAVSNIESRNPETVRAGNERVIRPRLSDAAYFFDTDRTRSLESRLEGLGDVVFQRKLGSLLARAQRVSALAGRVARAMGESGEAVADAERAGLLCKCDLLTEMVGEFPELQGEMGREYARLDGEPAAVAEAIGEVYMPRFADDAIPGTAAGRAVAIADKLDTIAGCLSLGQAPTGDKDPFALRRAALGTLRIMIEGGLDLDLDEMIESAFDCYGVQSRDDPDIAAREGWPDDMVASVIMASPSTVMEVRRFMLDRLRAYFADRAIPTDVFNAVLATEPTRPLDFANRVRAVEAFRIPSRGGEPRRGQQAHSQHSPPGGAGEDRRSRRSRRFAVSRERRTESRGHACRDRAACSCDARGGRLHRRARDPRRAARPRRPLLRHREGDGRRRSPARQPACPARPDRRTVHGNRRTSRCCNRPANEPPRLCRRAMRGGPRP